MSRRSYVRFFSPGTLIAEETKLPIESWNVRRAVELASGVVERHGATPYAFVFEEYIEHEPIDDGEGGTLDVVPKCVRTSGPHFLGGTLETFDEIERRADKRDEILLSNMRCSGWPIVIVTTNSFKAVQPFLENACIVDAGHIVVRGSDADLMKYRTSCRARWNAERQA